MASVQGQLSPSEASCHSQHRALPALCPRAGRQKLSWHPAAAWIGTAAATRNSMTRADRRGSPRMFASDFLERFSRAHPLTPLVVYLPVVAMSITLALRREAASYAALGVLAGYVLWTVSEYWLHRTLFHLKVIGPRTARVAFLVHGVHHDNPWDETRLVMPAGASLCLCALTYAAFRLALGPSLWAPFAGFVFGYVVYDEVHWYLHVGRPKSRFGRWLRREHLTHHFKDPASRFGVSCPWLDYLFGSRGIPRELPRRNHDGPDVALPEAKLGLVGARSKRAEAL
jgi:dihydroceramide fatty acyl 2-hydroxylase